ncbi:MAG: rhodanese-like domain-containing protein [Alphaproteobacteria bacterium]
MWTDITIDDMLKNIKSDEKSVIVDVRTEAEWRGTGIPSVADTETLANTIVYPPEMLPNENFLADFEASVDKDTTVYFVCRSGRRSQISSTMADEKGYKCYNVLGGMIDWIESGHPTMDYES